VPDDADFIFRGSRFLPQWHAAMYRYAAMSWRALAPLCRMPLCTMLIVFSLRRRSADISMISFADCAISTPPDFFFFLPPCRRLLLIFLIHLGADAVAVFFFCSPFCIVMPPGECRFYRYFAAFTSLLCPAAVIYAAPSADVLRRHMPPLPSSRCFSFQLFTFFSPPRVAAI